MRKIMKTMQKLLFLMSIVSIGSLYPSCNAIDLINCQMDSLTGNCIFKKGESSVATAFAQMRMPKTVQFMKNHFNFGSVREFLKSSNVNVDAQTLCQQVGEHFKCFKNMENGQLEYAWFNKVRRRWQGVPVSEVKKHIPEIVDFLSNKVTTVVSNPSVKRVKLDPRQVFNALAYNPYAFILNALPPKSVPLLASATPVVTPIIASAVPAVTPRQAATVAAVSSPKLYPVKVGAVGVTLGLVGYSAYQVYNSRMQSQVVSESYCDRAQRFMTVHPYRTAGSAALLVALGYTVYKYRDALKQFVYDSTQS